MFRIPTQVDLLEALDLEILCPSYGQMSYATQVLQDLYREYRADKENPSSPFIRFADMEHAGHINPLDALDALQTKRIQITYQCAAQGHQFEVIFYRDSSVLIRFCEDTGRSAEVNYVAWPFDLTTQVNSDVDIAIGDASTPPYFSIQSPLGIPNLFRLFGENDDENTEAGKTRHALHQSIKEDCHKIVDALAGSLPLAKGQKLLEQSMFGTGIVPFYLDRLLQKEQMRPLEDFMKDVCIWLVHTTDADAITLAARGRTISPGGDISGFTINVSPAHKYDNHPKVLEITKFMDSRQAPIDLDLQLASFGRSNTNLVQAGADKSQDEHTSHEIVAAISRVTMALAGSI